MGKIPISICIATILSTLETSAQLVSIRPHLLLGSHSLAHLHSTFTVDSRELASRASSNLIRSCCVKKQNSHLSVLLKTCEQCCS